MNVKEKAKKAYQEKLDLEAKVEEERERLKFLELKEIFPELEIESKYKYKIGDLLFYITRGKLFTDDNKLYLKPLENYPYLFDSFYIRDYATLGEYIIALERKKELQEISEKEKEKEEVFEKELNLKQKILKMFSIKYKANNV